MVRSLLALSLSLLPAFVLAASPAAELTRPAGKPQAVGVVHTVRGIPEACARLEGVFTGDDAAPYRISPVKTSPQCQPRARLVSFEKAHPSAEKGWKLNERIAVIREVTIGHPPKPLLRAETWSSDPSARDFIGYIPPDSLRLAAETVWKEYQAAIAAPKSGSPDAIAA